MNIIIKEKGITLISLVITLVVLMFLAGIIITASSENNGVLNIANSKKEETEKMTIEETIKTELQEDPPESYSELIKLLKNYGEIQNEDVPEDAILITKNGNYKIYVKDIWNIDKDNLEISIGDYVKYSYNGGSYTVDSTHSGTNQNQTIQVPASSNTIWRVINVNSQDKQIKIVPSNINNLTVTLSGVDGFNNGVKILNDLCNNLFSNAQYNATARNINIEDIEKISSNISELRGNNYGTEKEYSSLICPEIVKQENDISMQNDFFNNYETLDKVTLMQTFYSGNIEFINTNYNNLLPSGAYWISTRAVNNSDNADYFIRTLKISNSVNLDGESLFNSNGQSKSNTYSILPVVTLDYTKFSTGDGKQESPYKY